MIEHSHMESFFTGRGASLSDCGQYRYRLWQQWSNGRVLTWVMLNPSTADHLKDDPTIRRVRGFSERWDFGSFQVINLFALRSTDPNQLLRAMAEGEDVFGPENEQAIRSALADTHCDVICAWGAHKATQTPAGQRAIQLVRQLSGRRLCTLGTTKNGSPRHPLYLPNGTERQRWREFAGKEGVA